LLSKGYGSFGRLASPDAQVNSARDYPLRSWAKRKLLADPSWLTEALAIHIAIHISVVYDVLLSRQRSRVRVPSSPPFKDLPEFLHFPADTKRHKMGTLDGSPPRQSSSFLRFSWEQKRDHGLLRLALFGRDRLRIRIERHANRRAVGSNWNTHWKTLRGIATRTGNSACRCKRS
jgi:hypothetical protein